MPRTLSAGVVIRPASNWPAGSRIIQERRRVVVSGADDEGDLVFLLQIVEFFGELGKLVERANRVRAEGEIPDLVFIGVLLQRRVQRLTETPIPAEAAYRPFAGSSFGITWRSNTPHGLSSSPAIVGLSWPPQQISPATNVP